MRSKLLCAAVALSVAVAGSQTAGAQELAVQLRLIQKKPEPPVDGKAPPPPTDPVASWVPPIFRAVITARPGLVAKDFTLKQTDVQPPILVPAEKSVTFKESDEPMTLVILVQGNFRWLGNQP